MIFGAIAKFSGVYLELILITSLMQVQSPLIFLGRLNWGVLERIQDRFALADSNCTIFHRSLKKFSFMKIALSYQPYAARNGAIC